MQYLVKSGNLLAIVTAKTPEEACGKALDDCKGKTIDQHYFYLYELVQKKTIEVRKILTQ